MGRFAPAFGLIGTLIGLISMLRGISGEMEALGSGMALAVLTTFYGLLSAYLLFLPIAERLEHRIEKDAFQVRIIIDGVLMIQEGENPDRMEQKLRESLDPEQRMKHFDQMFQRDR
jgi:chemotaxis protein MotA